MSELRVNTISENTSGNGVAIDSVTLKDGGATLTDNITFSASSKGVHLGVTSATASNLLDDYEEGTWTPTATNTSDWSGFAATNMGVSMARYTKVGRKVSIMAKISFPDSGSSALAQGDHIQIDGLPFSIGGSGTDDVFGSIPAQVFLRDSTNGGIAHSNINYLDDISLRVVAVNGSGRRDQTILSLSGTYFAD
mgnify:CR=1 FL=1|tara:strand:- start:1307 stop:1888 length:582 start_codon:yes stop_codon:yes gene_type:complete